MVYGNKGELSSPYLLTPKIKLEFQKNILNIEKIRNIFTEYDRGVLFWE